MSVLFKMIGLAPDCKFCRVAAGALAADIVYEDAATLAFLDIRPLFPGHCLVVPRQHWETLPDLPPEMLGPLFSTARLIARAVETGLGADGSFVAVNNRISQSVPHLHIHVVPRRRKDGLKGFFWPRQSYPDRESALEVVRALKQALTNLGIA